MENKDKTLKRAKSSSSKSPTRKNIFELDVPPSPKKFTFQMSSPQKQQSITKKSPQSKYEKYLKYQKRGYVTPNEMEKFYPSIDPEFQKTLPFENEMQTILGDEYFDTLQTLVDTADKKNYAYWNYKMYMIRDMGFRDFDTSIADAPKVIDYIYYLYLRFGDPSQYFQKTNEGKFNVIQSVVEMEVDDNDETEFKITYDNYKFDSEIDLSLKPYGNLKIETENVSIKDVDQYREIKVKLESSDDDEFEIPSEEDLEYFGFENDLLKMLQKSKVKLNAFIYDMLYIYNQNSSLIVIYQDNYYLPEDTLADLFKNFTTRYAIVPVVLPGHQNLLIVDRQFKTIERFEPHGKNSYIRLFISYVGDPKFRQLLDSQGLKNLMLNAINNNYSMQPYYTTPEYRQLIKVIHDYAKKQGENGKYYEHISDFLLADYRLGTIDWDNYHLPGYTYISPYWYQSDVGPQTFYDYKEDIPMPTGLCVAFCFIYSMLRMNVKTEDDFIFLQRNINEELYKFLFEWYVKNVDSSIDLEKTTKDQKIFVKSAIVEFIVTANDKYYKILFDNINELFKTSFLSTGGRTFFA
jgi:hypothetical protein